MAGLVYLLKGDETVKMIMRLFSNWQLMGVFDSHFTELRINSNQSLCCKGREMLSSSPTSIKFLKGMIISVLSALFGILLLGLVLGIIGKLGTDVHPARFQVPEKANSYLLKNVNIVLLEGDGSVQRNMDVQVLDGKIAKISSTNTTEYSGKSYDGKGMYMMPGLIDSHVHIEDSSYLGLSLSQGVTTVRGMRGNSNQLRWRNEIDSNKWLGSRFFVYSPIIDGNFDPFHKQVTDASQAQILVKKYAESGYDGIKLYSSMSPSVFNAIVKTAQEIGIPIAKHGPLPVHREDILSNSQVGSIEHIENIFSDLLHYSKDPEKLKEVIKLLKDEGTPVVTTLSVYNELTKLSLYKRNYLDKIPFQYMNEAHRSLTNIFGVQRWLNSSDSLAQRNTDDYNYLKFLAYTMYSAGVPLVVGSDSGALIGQAGFATHREMNILVSAGIPVIDVLKSATLIPAKILGKENVLGTISEGAFADFILTESNPMQSISALATPVIVAKNGILLDKEELIELAANATLTQSSIFTYAYLLLESIERLL